LGSAGLFRTSAVSAARLPPQCCFDRNAVVWILHGQLVGHEPSDALILVAITARSKRNRVARPAAHVARAAAAIGLHVAGLFSDAYNRAFDAGLRPGPFPNRAGNLPPGLLVATRTGLTPAGDDKLMSD
jgi:hypothetical protein